MMTEDVMTKIVARDDFGGIIARAGLTRTELARQANISTRTLDALARKETYGRTGAVRESTAWKVAHAYAKLKTVTSEAAFAHLFVEVEVEDDEGNEQ